jgi:mono/diheme cytochrome c family protein
MQRIHFAVCVIAVASMVSGCGKPAAPRFHLDMVAAAEKSALDDDRRQNQEKVSNILVALLGTPDEPQLPPELSANLNINLIRKAAGPVNSDASDRKFGLFREHCVQCHGITGDGKGSLARFLKPYPRDYRQGTFKFKTTAGTGRPSDADLMRILVEGINNTSMPSFRLLSQKDREALVEYVKYLSVRGKTEAALYDLVKELSPDKDKDPNPVIDFKYDTFVKETLVPIAQEWTDANTSTIEIPEPVGKVFVWTPVNERESHKDKDGKTVTYETSIANGRALFFSESKGACYTCHGPTAMGDGRADLDDNWNGKVRSVSKLLGDAKQTKQLNWVISSSLPLRYNEPRNLRLGNYRFGNSPRDIYNKVHAGIDGSGMPGKPDLSPEEKWDIVNYVLSLPYEVGGGLGYDLRADTAKSQDIQQQSH